VDCAKGYNNLIKFDIKTKHNSERKNATVIFLKEEDNVNNLLNAIKEIAKQ